MSRDLNQQNKKYWQRYKPGEIPSVPQLPPDDLLNSVNGPILDVGTGDGVSAEKLATKGFDVYGIDIAKNIIFENNNRHSKVRYSVQDITSVTMFPDNFFDLIIFKFTLTNIHKASWVKVGNEIHRILNFSGRVWFLEPLVSDSYQSRYELASNFVNDSHCVYVFNDKKLAENIKTKSGLKKAIDTNQVSRIVKHYSIDELKQIFNKLKLTDNRIIPIISPSGFMINTCEGIFIKTKKIC